MAASRESEDEEMNLNELYLPRKGRSSEVGDLHQLLPAKGKLVLCDIRGPGVIGQICATHWNHGEDGPILASRGVVIRCYQPMVYDAEDNIVQWNGSASSIMRLFTLRLEPGPGRHLLAVQAAVSNNVPIRLESEAPGAMAAVLESDGGLIVTDGLGKVSEEAAPNRHDPATVGGWDNATVYPSDSYGDAAWFWLHSRGFRKFPGHMQRIWGKERLGSNRTVFFRKEFLLRQDDQSRGGTP